MKTSKIVLLIIGCLFVFANILAYKGNPNGIPSFDTNVDLTTGLIKFSGGLLGFNFFAVIGFILIIISLRKQKQHGQTKK